MLSRREIIALAFAALGKKPRILTVPAGMLRVSATLARPVNPRLAQIFRFYHAVSTTDVVAPLVGTRRLADYFRELAAPE